MSYLTRRHYLTALIAAASLPMLATAGPAKIAVEVWKDPSCGCCKDWIAHMESNGFTLTVHDTGNAAARQRLGLPQRLASCHTAQVEGYVLEGHIPAADVRRLLKDKPQALGLAVPGMPLGSPGMDGPVYQGRKDPYDVLLVKKSGNDVTTSVFTSHA